MVKHQLFGNNQMDDFLVAIRSDNQKLIGTGFFIENRIILTAGHVLADFDNSQELTVFHAGVPEGIKVKIISICNHPSNEEHLDYGLLEVLDPKFVAPGVAILSEENASQRESVSINGFAEGATGEGLYTNDGSISGQDFPVLSDRKIWVYSIKTIFEVRACQSGAPIIRAKDNKVIALQSKKTSGTDKETNLMLRAVGCPITRIRESSHEVWKIIDTRQNLDSKACRESSSTIKRTVQPKIRIMLSLEPYSEVGSVKFELITKTRNKLCDAEHVLDQVVLDSHTKWLAKNKFIVRWQLEPRMGPGFPAYPRPAAGILPGRAAPGLFIPARCHR
ncbi:MAG: hypothetical protein B7Z37_22980 [Verrucomicrobia bacterium 12-59-8]|nr:MAG: hypothetical protein B7Z37_22980 [Verrucomicrobia bacterium 12-59-8]